MVNILSGKLLILHLGTVLVSLVNMTHEFVLGTLIFRSRKAEIMHALSFAHQGSICLLHLARLSHAYHWESILCTGNQIVANITTSLQEWTICLTGHLRKTSIEHRGCHILQVTLKQIWQSTFQWIRSCLVLHHDVDDVILLLLVLIHYVDGCIVISYRNRNHLSSILRHLNAWEKLLDLALNMVNVYITNNDNSLIIRAIPLTIVSTECFRLTSVDNAH